MNTFLVGINSEGNLAAINLWAGMLAKVSVGNGVVLLTCQSSKCLCISSLLYDYLLYLRLDRQSRDVLAVMTQFFHDRLKFLARKKLCMVVFVIRVTEADKICKNPRMRRIFRYLRWRHNCKNNENIFEK